MMTIMMLIGIDKDPHMWVAGDSCYLCYKNDDDDEDDDVDV